MPEVDAHVLIDVVNLLAAGLGGLVTCSLAAVAERRTGVRHPRASADGVSWWTGLTVGISLLCMAGVYGLRLWAGTPWATPIELGFVCVGIHYVPLSMVPAALSPRDRKRLLHGLVGRVVPTTALGLVLLAQVGATAVGPVELALLVFALVTFVAFAEAMSSLGRAAIRAHGSPSARLLRSTLVAWALLNLCTLCTSDLVGGTSLVARVDPVMAAAVTPWVYGLLAGVKAVAAVAAGIVLVGLARRTRLGRALPRDTLLGYMDRECPGWTVGLEFEPPPVGAPPRPRMRRAQPSKASRRRRPATRPPAEPPPEPEDED